MLEMTEEFEEKALSEETDERICRYCHKTFKNATIRKRHERIHTDEAYQCHICSKRIAQKSHWVEHMQKVHQQTPEEVPVRPLKQEPIIEEADPASPTTQDDKFTFLNGKYYCGFCPKSFHTRSTIRRHERVHINPFICDYCGFKSGSKWHLRDHLMGHTRLIDPNQKLVKGRNNAIRKKSSRIYCDDCGRYFYSEHDLNSHKKRRHTLKIDKGSDLGMLFELFGHENEIKELNPAVDFVHFDDEPSENLITEVFVKEEPMNSEFLDPDLFGMSTNGDIDGLYRCSCGEKFARFVDLAFHESQFHADSFKECVDSMRDVLLKLLNVEIHAEIDEKDVPKVEIMEDRRPETYQDLISRNINVECIFCQASIVALSYDEHLKQAHPMENPVDARLQTQKYCCNCCLKTFKNLLALVKHIRSADHQLEGTSCDICTSDNYATLQELNSHRLAAHQNKAIPTCEQCQKTFLSNRLLKFHMLSHKGLKARRCKFCGCKFLSQEALDRHLPVHENEATRVCPTCGLEFRGREPLRQHMKNRHGVSKSGSASQPEIMCTTCGMVFKGKDRLRRHLARVHLERIFNIECQHCSKKFDSKHDLAKHIVVHSKEIKFFCEVCDKGFTRKQSLNRHIKVHDESTKVFTCTFCPKTFRSASNQKRHIMSHTGEKNQICTECDASYADRSCLNKHMERTHGHGLPGYQKMTGN
ncbi:zinc finger protein 594-like [Culicoides brevitarsis]|uniref:zinc finger protein 594-like n=1 Tax=Culicoides brevitarsis TaxID=469753 RepID=UPI00307B93FC